MKAQVTIETITPEAAQAYLTCQLEGQRNIRDSHVSDLALNMKRGVFRLSPDCITVVKGQLANGQHRLSAVIKADMPCEFLVMRTDDEELFKIIDSGSKRSASDCIGSCENKTSLTAAAQIIMCYERKLLRSSGIARGNMHLKSLTRFELIDFIEQNMEQLSLCVNLCCQLYRSAKIIQPSLTAALLFIASKTKNGDCAEPFITSLYTGCTLDDAAFDLRSRLLRERDGRGGDRGYKFALLLKSFNAYVLGIRPKFVRVVPGEEFPTV